MNKNIQSTTIVFLLCLVLALSIRLWSIDFGLPYRYHIDEPAYVISALQIGQGNIDIPYPPLSPSFQQLVYLFLYGVMFFVYFIFGWVQSPADLALLYKSDPSIFYLLARGISVITSVATIGLIFPLVKLIRNSSVALAAVLFLSLSFLDVRHAHFVEPYSIISMLIIGAIYLSILYLRRGNLKYLLLAGLISGIAVGIRPSVFPIGITLLLALFFHWRAPDKRTRIFFPFAYLGASCVIGYILGVPGIIVNTKNFIITMSSQLSSASSEGGFIGVLFTELPSWKFYISMAEVSYGVPLVILASIGFLLTITRLKQENILFLSFPVLYSSILLMAPGGSAAFARYLVPVLPFLAVLASDALITIIETVGKKIAPKTKIAVLVTLSIALAAIPAYRVLRLNYLWMQPDTRTLAKEWVEINLDEDSIIASQWYGPPLATNEDPEPNSKRVFNDFILLDPFKANPLEYDQNNYRVSYDVAYRDKVETVQNVKPDYLITSNFISELMYTDNEVKQAWNLYYLSLQERAELVAEFKPYRQNHQPKYFFEQMWGPIIDLGSLDHPGPWIKIYKLQ
jgi:hypothetical protein